MNLFDLSALSSFLIMSQRLNPTGRITGPGPNAMQRGDYGPWNVARVCPSPVPCEQTIYHEGGMLNDIHKIFCQNPCSYAVPCQECYQKSVLFAQFLLIFITYESLFYSVRLHCANLHTPLPFLFYLYDFQNIKTSQPDLFGVVLCKRHL